MIIIQIVCGCSPGPKKTWQNLSRIPRAPVNSIFNSPATNSIVNLFSGNVMLTLLL